MPDFLLQCGPFAWPLLFLSIVNCVLVVVSGLRLARQPRSLPDAGLESRINAILFWGGVAALLGFMGQHSGIYNAVHAIVAATEISPRVVLIGFAESFTTTLFGMTVLILSAVAWFALHSYYELLVRRVAR